MFYEIVVAPGYTPEGLEVLKGKSKALRILEAKARPPSGRSLRQVAGGWLLQVSCAAEAVHVLPTPQGMLCSCDPLALLEIIDPAALTTLLFTFEMKGQQETFIFIHHAHASDGGHCW